MNEIIKKYIPLVDFLGKVVGETTEIVLQDCEEGRIVAIANGSITGRTIGAPLTDLALSVITNECWKTEDYISGYVGRASNGRPLLSSTYFIKENDRLYGLLCINRDHNREKELLRELGSILNIRVSDQEPDHSDLPDGNASVPCREQFTVSVEDMIELAIAECTDGDVPIERLTKAERIRIVRYLQEKKIFMLKGAVTAVSQKLKCSEASVYRYLSVE